MKLCFICPEYPPEAHGGVGTFTQVLARALVRAGHDVRVIGLCESDRQSPGAEDDQGVRVWRMDTSKQRFGWVVDRWAQYRTIREWIASDEVDLVDAPDFSGWYAGWPKLPVPLVQRAHGSATYFAHELGRQVGKTGNRLEICSYRRADAWASVSEHAGRVTRRLFNLPRGPDAVLYCPVDAPETVPPFEARDHDSVVFTGTLTEKKGITPIIEAWPAIVEGHPAAKLHIFGKDQQRSDGTSMREYLVNRLPEALRTTVHFHGHRPRRELMQMLRTSRVAVFPSFTETFGFAPAEAMACGCPTIYTKLSCGPEIVRNGMDGLLVHPERRDEIAHAVLQLLGDRNLAARFAVAGRNRVLETFGLEKIVHQNEAFYDKVLNDFHSSVRRRPPAYAIDQRLHRDARAG